MNRTIRQWLGRSFFSMAAVGGLIGCASETPLDPDRRPAASVALAAPSVTALNSATDLATCGNLDVGAGFELKTRMYAKGSQIYRWDGTTWAFVAPDAQLFADPQGQAQAGSHYAGPTWESISGSKVIAAVVRRCTPDANSIPWLLLGAVSSTGPGVFDGVKFIQRINTTGGTAPVQPGTRIGETSNVPYTAEYLFYQAE